MRFTQELTKDLKMTLIAEELVLITFIILIKIIVLVTVQVLSQQNMMKKQVQ